MELRPLKFWETENMKSSIKLSLKQMQLEILNYLKKNFLKDVQKCNLAALKG